MRFKRIAKGVTGLRTGLAVLAILLMATEAFSQGMPFGTISGKAMAGGKGIPGVTVRATSPALIGGGRTVVTSENGDFLLANLPAGEYVVTYELSSFRTETHSIRLGASQVVKDDATMNLSTSVAATTEVFAQSEAISQSVTQATTYTSDILNKLPVTRTMLSAVILSPGVNQNGANAAVTISGSQSFENLYTVNGAQVTDNIRGTPFSLFIEDAIQETTTSTSGISAEYGRFQGGVINTITKSGGNKFSGSFRTSLANNSWSAITPAKEFREQKVNPTYEATAGGPIWTDKIWFFGAGRFAKTSAAAQTSSANAAPVLSYTTGQDEKRYEGKITLSPLQNHTLTGNYIKIDNAQTNYSFPLPIYDQASIYDRTLPQDLWFGNYNGVLTDKFFAEASYSSRKFTFENSGGRFNDLINGTTMHDQAGGGFFNSPIFCAICPGAAEVRSNKEYQAKLTYFLATPSVGSHNVRVGYDDFKGSRLSNNWQSGSSYFLNTTDVIFRGGDIFPVVDSNSYLGFYPILNVAQPSSIRTYSFYLNDEWRLGNRVSMNIGVRWDKNDAADSAGKVTANDSAFSPRLAVTYDPTGTGSVRFSASFARYVAAPSETQVGAGSNFGAPAAFYYGYYGAGINTDPTKPLLTRAQVLQQVFAYYGITAPNQFPTKNGDYLFPPTIPGVNTTIRSTLISPHTDEFTVGAGGAVGSRGNFRIDGVYRKSHDFYSLVTSLGTGRVSDAFGNNYDLGVETNTDDPLVRKYFGLNTQFSFRMGSLNVGGNWTWSHTYGNFIGETSGSGPVPGTIQQYAEYKQLSWNSPTGDLPQDQRHRVRLFGNYDLPFPRSLGTLGVSAIGAYDTGVPYGAVGAVRSRNYVTNPGYLSPPSSVTYYFSARDAFRTPDVMRLDMALNYSVKIANLVELFVQPQVVNVFNAQQIATNDANLINTTIRTAVSTAGFSNFNPFTTTPVAGAAGTGANYQIPAAFGTARAVGAYQQPRTFRVSFGLRF